MRTLEERVTLLEMMLRVHTEPAYETLERVAQRRINRETDQQIRQDLRMLETQFDEPDIEHEITGPGARQLL